jgi:thiol-disulfide isomerase/thioredoxin
MRKNYFYLGFVLLVCQLTIANDSIVLFSEAAKANLKEYIRKSNIAYQEKEYAKGEKLFSELVEQKLIGTQFDDFIFKKINRGKFKVANIKLPVILLTYASWCVFEKGEIPAINKLAQDYKNKAQIVIVFWDTKKNLKKIKHKFDRNVTVCYASEEYTEDSKAILLLKKGMGYPMQYHLDSNKEIVAIKKHIAKPNFEHNINESFTNNYNEYNSDLNDLLLIDSTNKNTFVSK